MINPQKAERMIEPEEGVGEEEQGLVVKGGVTVAATVQKLETNLSDAPSLSPVNTIQTNK